MAELTSMTKIVLVAGRVKPNDRVGHHDYAGGCTLLADLLAQTPGTQPRVVTGGWPERDADLDGAATLVFYDGGGGKQGFLADAGRIGRVDELMRAGVGLVVVHQAIAFPVEAASHSRAWLGGAYVPGTSVRGHWNAAHAHFPNHPVTRGVADWASDDGWLSNIQFGGAMTGVTPLMWAAKRQPAEHGISNAV